MANLICKKCNKTIFWCLDHGCTANQRFEIDGIMDRIKKTDPKLFDVDWGAVFERDL